MKKPIQKALDKKKGVVGDASTALKHHKMMAEKEKKSREPFIKKYGSFDERFKKFAEFKKNIYNK